MGNAFPHTVFLRSEIRYLISQSHKIAGEIVVLHVPVLPVIHLRLYMKSNTLKDLDCNWVSHHRNLPALVCSGLHLATASAPRTHCVSWWSKTTFSLPHRFGDGGMCSLIQERNPCRSNTCHSTLWFLMKAGHSYYHVILCDRYRDRSATLNVKKFNQPATSLTSHLTCQLNNPVIYHPTDLLTNHIGQPINQLSGEGTRRFSTALHWARSLDKTVHLPSSQPKDPF
jgi:hypothetical protein